MRQPDFIIGGATRGGIKTLSQILDHHSQIFIPKRKEHQFFHQGKILKPAPDTCKTPFEDASNIDYQVQIPSERILHGEQEFDPQRAFDGCPHAKIVFTLSNPVDRAYEQFQNAMMSKKETVQTFEEAIDSELMGRRTPQNSSRCWIFKNQYQTHIQEWLAFYPRNKIFIMIYEEWSDPVKNGLRELESFLGLKRDSLSLTHEDGFDAQKSFMKRFEERRRKYPPMDEMMRLHLEEILSIDKTYISNFIGRTISTWEQKF